MHGKEADPLATIYGQSLERPEHPAFEWVQDRGDFLLTYAGLMERVQRLGYALHEAGYGGGERIAICMDSRPAWPMAFLSIWYAGGTVVPLDTQLDSKALGLLLGHSEAVACVTNAVHLEKLTEACAGLQSPPVLLQVDSEGIPRWDGEPRDAGDVEVAPRSDGAGTDPSSDQEDSRSFDSLVAEYPLPVDAAWAPFPSPVETGTISYTSGTTGDPKGVMIRRSSWAVNISSGLEVVKFGPDDRLLGILPLFHVLPLITNCLGPAFVGASVVFLSELTAEKILAAFRDHRISVFICVPAFFYRFHDRVKKQIDALTGLRRRAARLLLGTTRFGRRRFGWNLGPVLLPAIRRPFGDDLRIFVTGAAKISAQVVEDFLDWGFPMAQGYGLTEATAILAISPLDGLRGDAIGPPIPGVEIEIHQPDEDGIGEIWARGPNVMEGYFKNPVATDEVLVDGWLKTGDLGCIQADGFVQVTGRAKDMIVLASGKNIFPDELEEHYSACELIDEMSIVGLPDAEGRGERLHAVIVPDLEAARRRGYVNIREMVKWELDGLAAELPSSRRPSSIEIRHEPLPRTTTRKVKRFELVQAALKREREEQLLASEVTARGGSRTEVGSGPEPTSKVEPGPGMAIAADQPEWMESVERMIAQLADRDQIRREEHLDLDLGLESLDRVELFAEIQDALGVDLGDEVAGELHTVGEVLDAVGQLYTGEAEGNPRVAEEDRWERILCQKPEGLDPYLRRRPITETLLWIVARIMGFCYRLVAGLRSTGQTNLPATYPFVMCPNHLSYTDPLMLAMVLPLRVFRRLFFVGYSEYFEGWFGSRMGRIVRNIPIDQNRQLEKAMQAAAEGLRRDMVLVIFPEGGRSIDGDLKEFRKGAGILAQHLGSPIVPVGLWGTFEMWKRGGKLTRHPVGVAIGEPLQQADSADEIALMEDVKERVGRLMSDAQELFPG
jgi:long-chain acyl-CoA synthetase